MWIVTNWRAVLIGSLLLGLLLTISAFKVASAERDLAKSELANFKRLAEAAATAAKTQSDQAIKETRNDYETLLVKEKGAFANYKKRFGAVACGTGGSGMPVQSGSDRAETGSTQGTDDPQREFVAACAHDAGTVKLWQDWATRLNLPISKE